jgi:SAM-dependent methyltransferase
MSDHKSGFPPGPPSQAAPPAGSQAPVAPPRSVPPAVTPQRIPVPGSSSLPGAASGPPPHPQLFPESPVDLDAEVEAAEDSNRSPEVAAVAPAAAVLEPMRPMRRLSIAEPGSSPGAASPAPERDRLPSFDDPEVGDLSGPAPEVEPVFSSTTAPTVPDLGTAPALPDDIDTPVPAAPVHVSAPPPFVPPPSPLLPDFAGAPARASSPVPRNLGELRSPSSPPAPLVPPPETPPSVEKRPSRPPPVVPDAVVHGMQPAAYQAEAAHDDEEMRLSEIDLITDQPPAVIVAREVEAAAVAPAPSPSPPPEAPAPIMSTDAPVSDGKKPPPPKRTVKPALPSAAVRRRPWWETLFGDDFARAHRSPTPRQLAHEVNFMVTTLALTQNQVVLDLGCGQGEHAVELTRRGVSVVGYDLSVFQLAMAGDRAQQEGQKINFLQGDMREMAFDSMFDAVVCWDTSFGYFEEEKNLDVARRIWSGLKPGGSLLLHVMNRDFAATESPSNIWFEGDGCVCMDDVDFDWITSRLRVKRSLILDDGRSKELHYSVRLYNLSELGKLLHDVGFRVSFVSGDVSTPGAFFGPASPYIIIRAQRP